VMYITLPYLLLNVANTHVDLEQCRSSKICGCCSFFYGDL